MAKIDRIILPGEREPVSHFCHVTRGGPIVWVSGLVGQAPDGSIPESMVEQFDIAVATRGK